MLIKPSVQMIVEASVRGCLATFLGLFVPFGTKEWIAYNSTMLTHQNRVTVRYA
jgi:hypothetical protein